MIKQKLTLFLLFFFLLLSSFYAVQAAPFSHSEWKKQKEDLDYTENVKKFDTKPGKETNAPGFDLSALKYPLFVVIIVVLLFFLIKLLSNIKTNPSLRSQASIYDDDLEERIHDIDLKALLEDALGNRRYQEAIRILFLIQIKILSDKKLISWQKQKTNYQYQKELKNELTGPFSHIRLIYEKAWFGKSTVTEDIYKLLSPDFQSFQNKLNAHE